MHYALVSIMIITSAFAVNANAVPGDLPLSRTITEVLRDPLPPEDLTCTGDDTRIVIQGPTFRYVVDRGTGVIAELEAMREGDKVVRLRAEGFTRISAAEPEKVVLSTEGRWGTLPYAVEHTFYNDGVVVSAVVLRPDEDLTIRNGLRYEVNATGRFNQYLHKRRDTEGMDSPKGALPDAGNSAILTTLTSCLQVYGTEAALAVFTDRGGTYRSPADIETAALRVDEKDGENASVNMTQNIINVGSGGQAYTLHEGGELRFRTGLAVAPNRLPHPRWRDLRMFIWIGDQDHPYPSDEEILTAARLGFTVFQMHRLGTPGLPRPPAGELDRVLKTVHDAGMLFVWTANADLMYRNAPGVQELIAADKWSLWQGFNYGGRYTASRDPYCDLIATCLASPNSLADYRIRSKIEMLEKYPVDGMYIDDNLAYANCTLWKEHGHPEQIYDCLIELHEMNWRRRQTLKSRRPHTVLIDHCSYGFVLPVIAAFDVHLFGEGYSFPSVETFWNTFASFKNMNAQGSLYAGDSEGVRCNAEIAYAFDLLTGGGQYCYLDSRLWPEKFPYAAGVRPEEALFVATYNLAQHYFGMYESRPHYFALSRDWFTTTAPGAYATIYENTVWNEALAILVNMNDRATTTSVLFHGHGIPLFTREESVTFYDINQRTIVICRGNELSGQFANQALAPIQIKLFHVRGVPENAPYHQWGGKRISEQWDPIARTLTLRLHGPVGLEDTVFLGANGHGFEQVFVDGVSMPFYADPGGMLVHGEVTFCSTPLTLVATCSENRDNQLPIRPIVPDQLTREVLSNR